MRRYPLLVAFLAAMAGVWSVEVLAPPVAAAGGVAVGAVIGLLVAVRKRRGVVIVGWLASGTLLGWARAGTEPPRAPPSCAQARGVRGYAASTWRGQIDGPIETRRGGARTVLALEAELCDGAWVARRGRVNVTLWDGPAVVRGDRVEILLAVEPIGMAGNPTDADAAIQARIAGVDATARVFSVHHVVEHERGLLAYVDVARSAAAIALTARLSAPHAAVARGLVMGDRGGLAAADREAWADAGLAHLLAVSGMHVTMVVVVISAGVRLFAGRVPGLVERWSLPRVAAVIALPTALLFCAWSASPASAVRATIMGGVGLVGVVLGRPARAVEALAFTGLVMLVEQPLLLHDAGFGLSMAAVAALLASPRLRVDSAALLARPLSRLLLTARRTVMLGFIASVSATLAALPLTAVFFGRVSLVAPLTNLAAVPIGATVATPLALVLVIVAPVAPRLADLLAVPLERLLGWLLAVVRFGEKLPGATVVLATPRTHELVFYVVSLVSAFAAARASRQRARLGLLSLAGAVGLVASGVARWVVTRARSELVVMVPYVGQGDGVIVHFPGGQTGVVDAGGAIATSDWDPGRQVIAPLLRRSGVATIDLAVVSHPHPDHIGGFVYLAERFRIAELWRSGQRDDAGALLRLEQSVMRRGGRIRAPAQLAATVNYGGISIDVVHPRIDETSYLPELDLNDNSVVLRLRHGARSILLTGDIEAIAEREIVAAGAQVAADVLKVAHHGSRTSSTPEMLDAVRPSLAVVSCGVHNQFGFPHPETIDRFRGRNIPLLSTSRFGAITLRSDGLTWRVSGHRPGLMLPATPILEEVPDDD